MPSHEEIHLFKIQGTIFDAFDRPFPSLVVKLFDKDLRSEKLLGQTSTDGRGKYAMTFARETALNPEHGSADVFVRAFKANGEKLSQSPVVFNVGESTTLDLKIGDSPFLGLNEYDRILDIIQPVVEAHGVKLGELKRDTDMDDFSFLAGDTGEDEDKIFLLNKAFIYSKKAQNDQRRTIDPAVFYGLLRIGFPRTFSEFVKINSKSFRNGILQAINENIISMQWEASLDAIVNIYAVVSGNEVATNPELDNEPFKKLFKGHLTPAQQKTFAATYFEHEEKTEAFWDVLKTKAGFRAAGLIPKVKQLMAAKDVAGQEDLGRYLFTKLGSDPDLKERSGYAKFSKADWKKHIANAELKEFPIWVQGESTDEKTDHYAESLENLHKQQYPTAFFSARIKQDARSSFKLKGRLLTFFKNNPEFDLGTKTIGHELKNAKFENGADRQALETEIKTINRLYRLSDDYQHVNALYGKQLHSSTEIVSKYGSESFSDEFSAVFGSPEKANSVYKKAVSISNKTVALLTAYKMRHDVKLFAIDGESAAPEGYHELFGDGELCECSHCQSVYSPAAYFTDLLSFMEREKSAAFNELMRRRPDLQHIHLTCKNTNTPLPYIDLVNELLEKEVIKLSGAVDREGITSPAHAYQTGGTVSMLKAVPENQSVVAYEQLTKVTGNSVFSVELPLDLPLEEYRIYTDKLGWDRYTMLELCYGNKMPGKMQDPALAASLFNLSEADIDLLNNKTQFSVSLPSSVKGLLDTTKFSYIQLLQLLETHFLNPISGGNRAMSIRQAGNESEVPLTLTCNLEELRLQGATVKWLKKTIRFVRFSQQIGWDIFDLDRALIALNVNDFPTSEVTFNERILLPIYHIERFRRALGISVRDAITLFGPIDTAVYRDHSKEGAPFVPSMYQLVFQNKAMVQNLSSSPFAASPESLTGTLLNYADVVCAVLGISMTELDAMQPEMSLSIKGLSKLYRGALLARALGETTSDLLQIASIIGNEFSTNPWNALSLSVFLEECQNFKSTGIKAHEYDSIVRNYGEQYPPMLNRIGFSLAEIDWLIEHKADASIEKLWSSESSSKEIYQSIKQAFNLARIAQKVSVQEISWKDLFNDESKSSWFEKFTRLFKIQEPILVIICGSKSDAGSKGLLNYSFPGDYHDAANLLAIIKCCGIIEALKCSDVQLNALLAVEITDTNAQIVKNLLRSKYDPEKWLEIIRPVNDHLRKRRRDSMVAWLIANGNAGQWNNPNDLFKYFLIDTEMEPCMMTSRIKQGISSIQLFIDRCLMNLETRLVKNEDGSISIKKINLGEDFSDQWNAWRKQYRVWEVNRKVFLYPENWIEPELRDDKSPFFKELESQLKQNEVTEETATDALRNYLQKLDSVARLEIVGLFHEEERETVHVFGRTYNLPHQYFYRKQVKQVWTAWEKVELDIEGDHILPVVWNGRLMLFWGIFTEKQASEGGSTTIKTESEGGSMSMISTPAKTYLEIKLAWSELKDGKWGGKKISQTAISTQHLIKGSEGKAASLDSNISQTSQISKGRLRINFHFKSDLSYDHFSLKTIGFFRFNSCNAAPSRKQFKDESEDEANVLQLDVALDPNKNWLKKSARSAGVAVFEEGLIQFEKQISVPILSTSNGSFRITPSRRLDSEPHFVPFVLSNGEVNLFVTAKSGPLPPQAMLDFPERNLSLSRIGFSPRLSGDQSARRISDNPAVIDEEDWLELEPSPGTRPRLRNSGFVNKYLFSSFYHPFVCNFKRILAENGLESLYKPRHQDSESASIFSKFEYLPTKYVSNPYPKEEMEFSISGSYSLYNWELFFHIPLLIATRLTQNQKFEEARRWFHFIFDPTKSPNQKSDSSRFWITKPFRDEARRGILSLEELLQSDGQELENQLSNWEENPFNPHAVARLRHSAYMRHTVIRYIDNLIQWGDQLFKKDTIESINEATLLYILASNLLGKRLEKVPQPHTPIDKSFALISEHVNSLATIQTAIEAFFSASESSEAILMPYFCLPKNDNLLKYWDTVADRLFKIRHCMNIEGAVRQLPLFEPPIDPGLLIRAKAAGLDLNSILDEGSPVLPHYRFQVMLQKANELCNDVKSLGSMLLSAIEKKDAEALALLRSGHEINMLEVIKDIKEKQREEAKLSLEALIKSKTVTENRFNYYGTKSFVNEFEVLYLSSIPVSMFYQNLQLSAQAVAAVNYAAPQVTIGPFSSGMTTGGLNLGEMATLGAANFGRLANLSNSIGTLANSMGGFMQRRDDWQFQAKSAELELKQIDKQIIAAEIRLAIADKELNNHELQIAQSREVNEYMLSKFTTAELYDWMVGQLSTIYFQSYTLAYTVAKKAEKCLEFELGSEPRGFVRYGNWDSLKKGLLSGEKLHFDLRRLENAYLEDNRREYEIVKQVSIQIIDPLALIQLRQTGTCTFEIPEALYDMDHPGQYFRRIKSVSVSLPCIAGPYTSVSAKLSLESSRYRKSRNVNEDGSDYPQKPGSDDRFVEHIGDIQSIATSHGQNDSGVFELNFRDERYLPFEYAGATSSWKLELPEVIKQFDYNTIADVIIHLKYTARDGGSTLKNAAQKTLNTQLNAMRTLVGEKGLQLAISIKHDFSNEWHLLQRKGVASVLLDRSRLPYFAKNFATSDVAKVTFIAKVKNTPTSIQIGINDEHITMPCIAELKLCMGSRLGINLNEPLKLAISIDNMPLIEELVLIVGYEV